MIVSDNTLQAEGLGNNKGKTSAKAGKKNSCKCN